MLTQIIQTNNPFHHDDVTDNKTSDNSPPILFKDSFAASFRSMTESLCREEERLKTFENRWPVRFMDMNILAQTGMYYTGSNDNVKCFFCGVEIGRWEITDHPVTEHMRWSPNCPLLRRRSTSNIPLDANALDRSLPPASYDVCGTNELIDIRPSAYPESSITSSPPSSIITMATSQTAAITTTATPTPNYLYPDHPEYAIESARLRSFAEWPRTMKQKPQELCDAGFFYTGIGDRVKCFSCGGGLKDWDETDDPWEQHALWLSNCRYLKLMKGKNYVDFVIAKHKTETNKQNDIKTNDLTSSSSINNNNQQNTIVSEIRNVETTSTSPAAAAISTTSSSSSTTKSCETENNAINNNFNRNETTTFEPKKISDDKLCKICYAGEYNTAFLPCGHVVACAKCASSVTKCPVCRKPFTDVMRVYFS